VLHSVIRFLDFPHHHKANVRSLRVEDAAALIVWQSSAEANGQISIFQRNASGLFCAISAPSPKA
jgi:hypothetical protein